MAAPQDRIAADLRVLLGRLNRRLRAEAAPNELTQSQKLVLHHLEGQGSATASGLARLAEVKPQSMSATLAVLEDEGLVAKAADPADGRQMLFSLTPKVIDLLKANRGAREDWLARALEARLSPAEAASLVALLSRLVEEGA